MTLHPQWPRPYPGPTASGLFQTPPDVPTPEPTPRPWDQWRSSTSHHRQCNPPSRPFCLQPSQVSVPRNKPQDPPIPGPLPPEPVSPTRHPVNAWQPTLDPACPHDTRQLYPDWAHCPPDLPGPLESLPKELAALIHDHLASSRHMPNHPKPRNWRQESWTTRDSTFTPPRSRPVKSSNLTFRHLPLPSYRPWLLNTPLAPSSRSKTPCPPPYFSPPTLIWIDLSFFILLCCSNLLADCVSHQTNKFCQGLIWDKSFFFHQIPFSLLKNPHSTLIFSHWIDAPPTWVLSAASPPVPALLYHPSTTKPYKLLALSWPSSPFASSLSSPSSPSSLIAPLPSPLRDPPSWCPKSCPSLDYPPQLQNLVNDKLGENFRILHTLFCSRTKPWKAVLFLNIPSTSWAHLSHIPLFNENLSLNFLN